jgi:transcriptional regulator with GAF, ATPase, and Fis domain
MNCAALPEHLLESELFGHEKGAFTGAHQARKGKFEAADGGTLFFDEIGEMPLSLQAKLLRVLEDQEITPVGGNATRKVNGRTVFATARTLEDAIADQHIREDLYYRINVVPIVLPPLRERGGDIMLLTERFLQRFNTLHGRSATLSEQARLALLRYSYPGNVRELRNAVERAVLLSGESGIHVGHLPSASGTARTVPLPIWRSRCGAADPRGGRIKL